MAWEPSVARKMMKPNNRRVLFYGQDGPRGSNRGLDVEADVHPEVDWDRDTGILMGTDMSDPTPDEGDVPTPDTGRDDWRDYYSVTVDTLV